MELLEYLHIMMLWGFFLYLLEANLEKFLFMLKWSLFLHAFEATWLSIKYFCSRLGFLNIHEKTEGIL